MATESSMDLEEGLLPHREKMSKLDITLNRLLEGSHGHLKPT
jgi:hypothetical protein